MKRRHPVKEYGAILAKLEAQGWRVRQGTRHVRLFPPDLGQPPYTMSNSPSDWRSWRNMLCELKRRGAKL